MRTQEVFVVCRHGLLSQDVATKLLRFSEQGFFSRSQSQALREGRILYIEGGLAQWSATIDPAFPIYDEETLDHQEHSWERPGDAYACMRK